MKHIIRGMMWVTLSILWGCSPKKWKAIDQKKYNTVKDVSFGRFSFDKARLQEAKMSDIPIPISAIPVPEYFEDLSIVPMLGYIDPILSVADTQSFYVREMERLGWKAKETLVGYESQLRFKKPKRICWISIRPNGLKKGSYFVISIGSTANVSIS